MESFREQVLFVGEVEDDIDLNSLPTTGEEYIKRVILEARQCQDVVVQPMDVTQSKQPTPIESSSDANLTPNYLMPSQEWQDLQIKDFSKVRLYIAGIRSKKKLLPQMTKKLPIELPDIEDEKSWLKICLGNDETCQYLSPKLNVILSLNQPATERILEYLITWVKNQKKIPHNIGRWIYALLVSLELPLNPDTCSFLRLLAKCCQDMRINLDSAQSPEINIHNLFICLVGKYFRQLDLVDVIRE